MRRSQRKREKGGVIGKDKDDDELEVREDKEEDEWMN